MFEIELAKTCPVCKKNLFLIVKVNLTDTIVSFINCPRCNFELPQVVTLNSLKYCGLLPKDWYEEFTAKMQKTLKNRSSFDPQVEGK